MGFWRGSAPDLEMAVFMPRPHMASSLCEEEEQGRGKVLILTFSVLSVQAPSTLLTLMTLLYVNNLLKRYILNSHIWMEASVCDWGDTIQPFTGIYGRISSYHHSGDTKDSLSHHSHSCPIASQKHSQSSRREGTENGQSGMSLF